MAKKKKKQVKEGRGWGGKRKKTRNKSVTRRKNHEVDTSASEKLAQVAGEIEAQQEGFGDDARRIAGLANQQIGSLSEERIRQLRAFDLIKRRNAKEDAQAAKAASAKTNLDTAYKAVSEEGRMMREGANALRRRMRQYAADDRQRHQEYAENARQENWAALNKKRQRRWLSAQESQRRFQEEGKAFENKRSMKDITSGANPELWQTQEEPALMKRFYQDAVHEAQERGVKLADTQRHFLTQKKMAENIAAKKTHEPDLRQVIEADAAHRRQTAMIQEGTPGVGSKYHPGYGGTEAAAIPRGAGGGGGMLRAITEGFKSLAGATEKQAKSEEDEAKAEEKEAEAEGEAVKAKKALEEGGGKAKATSDIFFILLITTVGLLTFLKIKMSGDVKASLGIELLILTIVWLSYGAGAFNVFLLSFFVPLIAGGIVSGVGIPLWTVLIIVAILFLSGSKFRDEIKNPEFLVMFLIVVVSVLIIVYKIFGFSSYVFKGITMTPDTPWGLLFVSLANPLFNLWWIWYVGLWRNRGEEGRGVIKFVVRTALIVFSIAIVIGGFVSTAQAHFNELRTQGVTDEQKAQFKVAIERGDKFYENVPVFNKIFGATSKLFSLMESRTVAAAGGYGPKEYAGSEASDGMAAANGLVLKEADYMQKVFGKGENVYIDAVISEQSQVAEKVHFLKTECKIGREPPIEGEKDFYFISPEDREFTCSIGNDLDTGRYKVKVKAAYEFDTTSSYTAVFADFLKKREIGENILNVCDLEEYKQPTAEFNPPSSPASLGIALPQKTMPISVTDRRYCADNPDCPKLPVLIATIDSRNKGYVSGIRDLFIVLPDGLKMDTTAPSCSFESDPGDAQRYILKDDKKKLYNPASMDYISYRCPLEIEDAGVLLGNALCAPRTIHAMADYEFTLVKDISGIEVRELV